MNIINDNIFNQQTNVSNKDNKCTKIILKSMLIVVAKQLISVNYHKI